MAILSWLRLRFPLCVWTLVLLVSPSVVRGQSPASVADKAKPNIVFILFDDLGYGQPACYRAKSEFKTPNLDRFAHEGMLFTDAHSASSVCTPTRYGVLTGRSPMRIGQYGVLTTFSPPIIEPGRLTVASLLKRYGYTTAAIGKWHLGMTWANAKKANEKDGAPIGTIHTNGPLSLGFDRFYGFTHARNIGMLIEQDKVVANVQPVEVQPLLAKKAVEFIDERTQQGCPFFLYLPLATPHTPIVPAKEFEGKGGANAYADWLHQGDQVTGQILDALQRNKVVDNTLVIVTSDNGAANRVYPPLRDCKTSIYEGGHREPFLARWPGRIKAGAVSDDTICLNDLLATCAEIVGHKLPDNAGEDSVSILPLLLGTAKAPVRNSTIHQSARGDLAIRQGPWKLIFLNNGRKELYNLKDDLSETQNLVATSPDIADRLAKLMQQSIANGRSTPGAVQKNAVEIDLDRPRMGKGQKKE